jgi:hypothetical protein
MKSSVQNFAKQALQLLRALLTFIYPMIVLFGLRYLEPKSLAIVLVLFGFLNLFPSDILQIPSGMRYAMSCLVFFCL